MSKDTKMASATQPFSNPISPKLSEDNFLTWKQEAEATIEKFGLKNHILGLEMIHAKYKDEGDKIKDVTTEEYKQFEQQDRILKSWLLDSMQPQFKACMVGCDWSFQVWYLVEAYIASQLNIQWERYLFFYWMRNVAVSLLDESKTRSLQLSEIQGHVVYFSADQYGSRFIQQKLETASMEEKNMVFQEITPQARSLATHIFGNYVIQKFFEHGTADQRRELAHQLTDHVLELSLQECGNRVIQKAIEVVELVQRTKLVKELDGHIMHCVRDQHGNHVIQKYIECVPEDAIQFIVSTFYNQVVRLSTHPYGCRVIQTVLDYCNDPKTRQIMMDEILQSLCTLAQDKYGNYVVQRVLKHGKPPERSAIIKELTGKIVQMSQHMFATRVIAKCLTFGTSTERQVLVNEMLGATDENEPLLVMMKDQFAYYVVQKALETCDVQQLELILSLIKVHLNDMKKYGMHIVARVEKLVAAGESRIRRLDEKLCTANWPPLQIYRS